MTDAEEALQAQQAAAAALDQAGADFAAGRISSDDLQAARNAETEARNRETDARNAETDARNAQFAAAQQPPTATPPPSDPPPEPEATHETIPIVAPAPVQSGSAISAPAMNTIPSPAFDINGNLVTVDLPGGNYSNLPTGYFVSPGDAAVARHVETQTGTPATAQQVGKLFSDTSAATQSQIQQIFDAPPPASAYVAPTPPAAQGWVAPAVTTPPTSADLIAQSYRDNGYTPPSAGVIQQIISGEITAPITEPLHAASVSPVPVVVDNSPPQANNATQAPASMTAADYAANRSDLVVNWARAQNPGWVAANPGAAGVVAFIKQFPTLAAYLSNDYGSALSGSASVPAEIANAVAAEVPLTINTGGGNMVNPGLEPPAASVNSPIVTPGAGEVPYLIGDPSHKYLGRVNGHDVYQLTDSNRQIVQWQVIAGHDSREIIQSTLQNVGHADAPADVTPVTVNQTPRAVGGGGSGPIPSPTVSALFDPTHRSIGWDAQGKENFIQIDENGNVIAYASDGTNLRNLGPATMNAAAMAATLLAQNPFKTNPLAQPAGGGGGSGGGGSSGGSGGGGSGGGSNNAILYVGLAAVAGLLLARATRKP